MGVLDIALRRNYGISYPIKGVLYCTAERTQPGGLFQQQLPRGNHECIVFQDALGKYYLYYDFSQGGGGCLAKFRAPRGTMVSDFVKNYFRGGVKGVDMDLVLPENEYERDYQTLRKEERDLAKLQAQAEAQSRCVCDMWLETRNWHA